MRFIELAGEINTRMCLTSSWTNWRWHSIVDAQLIVRPRDLRPRSHQLDVHTDKARAKMGRAYPKPAAASGRRQRVKTSETRY